MTLLVAAEGVADDVLEAQGASLEEAGKPHCYGARHSAQLQKQCVSQIAAVRVAPLDEVWVPGRMDAAGKMHLLEVLMS